MKGFLLTKFKEDEITKQVTYENDYLVISKDGINLLSLGYKKEAKIVRDKENLKRKIHSLGSVDYLKNEDDNHILFACQFYDDRQIHVQEQYKYDENRNKKKNIFDQTQ